MVQNQTKAGHRVETPPPRSLWGGGMHKTRAVATILLVSFSYIHRNLSIPSIHRVHKTRDNSMFFFGHIHRSLSITSIHHVHKTHAVVTILFVYFGHILRALIITSIHHVHKTRDNCIFFLVIFIGLYPSHLSITCRRLVTILFFSFDQKSASGSMHHMYSCLFLTKQTKLTKTIETKSGVSFDKRVHRALCITCI